METVSFHRFSGTPLSNKYPKHNENTTPRLHPQHRRAGSLYPPQRDGHQQQRVAHVQRRHIDGFEPWLLQRPPCKKFIFIFGFSTENTPIFQPASQSLKIQRSTGILTLYTRTLRLVHGGFQLYFGVEKASHVSNGCKMQIFFRWFQMASNGKWFQLVAKSHMFQMVAKRRFLLRSPEYVDTFRETTN